MYGISTYAGAAFIIDSRNANAACRFAPTTAGCFSGGTVVTTFVAVLLGALSFGQIGPLLGQIGAARAAAADLFGVIDAVPAVDVGCAVFPSLRRAIAGVASDDDAVAFAGACA
jgi:hypothetical protein